jgi:hypothetical protein
MVGTALRAPLPTLRFDGQETKVAALLSPIAIWIAGRYLGRRRIFYTSEFRTWSRFATDMAAGKCVNGLVDAAIVRQLDALRDHGPVFPGVYNSLLNCTCRWCPGSALRPCSGRKPGIGNLSEQVSCDDPPGDRVVRVLKWRKGDEDVA